MGLLKILGTLSPIHIKWFTWAKRGQHVGTDFRGNKYYQAPPRPGYKNPRRWVIYKGEEEATRVPPEWHGWLHYQTDQIPEEQGSPYRQEWQKPHEPNYTGTDKKYLPPGHVLKKGERQKSAGDYQAWTPPE